MSAKTIEAEPDNATYLDTYGWILYLLGKPEEAEKILKDYVSPDPVFDRERYFLESNAYLELSRQALQEASFYWWPLALGYSC